MNSSRTYVFAFVPIPAEWTPRPAVHSSNGDRNGSSLTDRRHDQTLRWLGRDRQESDRQLLPSHLFWTWFVDNLRRCQPERR